MLLHNVGDIEYWREQVRNAAAATRQNPLDNLNINGMEALYTLKFGPNGNHPL